MLKAIKIRIYPTHDQITYINKLLGSSRFVYNQCLDWKIDQWKSNGKSTGLKDTGKYLLDLKSQKEWLKEAHSKVLQQSLMNLEVAYKNFFKSGSGFPKFKRKHEKQSCRFPVDAISKIKGNRINIIRPLSDIHFKCSSKDESYLNKHQELIKSGTLTKTKSDNYYFSILIDRPSKSLPESNKITGIDLGIKDFVVDSNGKTWENLKSKRLNKNKLTKLHKELSRKVKGSSNREKSRIKLSRFYEKLTNIKEHYLHSVVNQLLSENQTIVMEDLNIKGMMQNHKLAKSIQEISLYKFKQILKYKAHWYGREVIEVSRWFPSSKLCSSCGWKNVDLQLNERQWDCLVCGSSHCRDVNAAINLRNEGIKIKIGLSSPELTPLESSPLGSRRIRNQNVKLVETVEFI